MPKAKAPSRSSYHHGNLRDALLTAAIQLVEEGGPENVSLREVAKRAGVSAGAPFRHFQNKTALMTAVAEQAMDLLRLEVMTAIESVASDDPLQRFAAVGSAYLRWSFQNPTHFQMISQRNLNDWGSSTSLRDDNKLIRSLLEDALVDAYREERLRPVNIAHTSIAGRALIYGLARMFIDGHFAQWALSGEAAEQTAQNILKQFVNLLGYEQPAAPAKKAAGISKPRRKGSK